MGLSKANSKNFVSGPRDYGDFKREHTWLRSIRPAVNGLSFLDRSGGHFKMKFLNRSEYLK